MAATLLPAFAESGSPLSETLTFAEADWVVTPHDETPLLTSGWTRVPLPDPDATERYTGTRLGRRPRGTDDAPLHWYRFHVNLTAPIDGQIALFTPRFSDRARVYVNGSMIDRTFLQPERVEHGWNHPIWSVIPSIALEPGRNEILIGLDSPYTGSVGLSRVWLGPPEALRTRYEISYMLRVGAAQAGTWMLGGLAIFSLGVWAVRRSETLHLLLGLGAAMFSVRLLHYFLIVPPVSPAFFWWLTVVSLPWAMLFLFLFAFHYYGIQRRWLTAVLLAIAMAMTLLLAPGVGFDAYEAAPWVYLGLIPIALFTAGLLLQRAWRHRGAPQILLAVGYGITIVASSHDLLVMTHISSIELPYVMPIGAVVLFLSFSLALGARYVEWLGEFEAMNRTLEARVHERQVALEESFERLEAMGREQVLADERQRLMREIHDGIGSNLVATLAALQSRDSGDNAAVRALRGAISDLKLTVDSLEPVEGDLLSLLGNLRYRLAPQLEYAGIEMEWQAAPLPQLEWLRAPQALHVLRIAQEALGNVIQHAGADRVTVATMHHPGSGADPGTVEVRISDNGRGFVAGGDGSAAGHEPGGKGLANMRHRAEALGGRLRVYSRPGAGTSIALELPVVLSVVQSGG